MPNTICEELSFTNLNELPQPVNIYTPEEAYEASLNYFNGDELAASAFVSKYALKRKEGDSWIYYELTPDDMHKRIARELARIEENYPNPLSYEEIYNTIKDFKYIVPQGSPMAGIGNPFQLVSLSNCVVIEGPQDSISKIMDTAKDLANLSKRRAGVGTPMDALRPDGTKVNNSAGTSTGAWSFCNHFSNIAGVIGQGGRRAALMLSMLCNHPDIMKFVVMKHDRKNTTNANVSVMITDEFMQAVINDSEWDLVWPVDSTPETAKVHEVIKARDLWRLINESATHHAEPGLLFWDNYLKNLPAECYAEDGFKTICVNPCCFSEDSEVWVPTRAGLKEIKTITPEDEVWVDSTQEYVKTSGYFHAGEAEVFFVKFSGGETLEITANHKLVKFQVDKVSDSSWERATTELIELQNLKIGDLIVTPIYDGNNVTEIISIESKGIKPVGCIEVPEYHQFVANGICSGNSEIGLSAYDSCRLMSINLKNFVINPFEKNAHFDFKTFARIVSIGQRLMDDIVDLEIEALDNIINNVDDYDEKILWGKLKQAAIDGRRTGLGTHALADCLACLGIKYDTPEALDIVDKIYQMFRDVSYLQGTQLAAERGPFSCFSWEKEKDNAFIQRLPEYVKNSIKEHGRRNISQLTMAPTGTVSIECQTSSGIEPVFRIYYSRKKKINPSDTNMRVDFEDVVGNKWQIFDVFHHNVLDYFKKHPDILEQWEEIKVKYPPEKREEKLREILPDYFISSDQINWESRIDLQGIIQSYICHGISSTINLPRNTPVEEVEKIYMRAWERGLKGVTVYVEGSREDVLSSNVAASDRPSDVSETHAPKRPDILPCDIHYSSIDNLQWIIFVSKFNNKPYEIFAGLAENVDIPKKYSEGFIKKRNGEKANAKGRTARYDLIVGDTSENKKIIEDIVVTFDNPGYATQTRLISCLLRHGVSVSTIAEQLSRDLNENLFSFNKVIARVLKKYIKDGTGSGENCSNCGAKLRFEGGCYICPSCAESKCG